MSPATKSHLEESSQIAWIILRAVKQLQTGKYKLAAFLKGSKSKIVSPIIDKQLYGGLMWQTIPTIMDCINQLEDHSLIYQKIVHTFTHTYPILELTPLGQQTLDEKRPVAIEVRKIIQPVVVGASERKTLDLYQQGKSVQAIMQERNIARSTVYTHFFRLITNHYLSSEEVIAEEVIKEVSKVAKTFSHLPSVKEIKELLPGVSYEEIRCTLIGLERTSEHIKES